VKDGAPADVVKPELLAPAGDWECARAAVENGADAIYFGLDRFNARMRAGNFTIDELPGLMAFLHERGVRGYLAFNTLVFPGELEDAAAFVRHAVAAGVDAIIVQDVGLCRLIRRVSPDVPIHASTQMTVTSSAGVTMAEELGASLVVVARECSIADIARIRDRLGPRCLPIEAFVHGALCVAYSGQCLTSEALGGRSANRGECAQACRLPYELIADGQPVPLGDRRYLLSPRDLAGLELVPAMLCAGVVSFKIEGRLKTPNYVASITRIYREVIDASLGEGSAAAADEAALRIRRAREYQMEMAFSRGLGTGWLAGTDNKALVHARYPKKRGPCLGKVVDVRGASVRVRSTSEGPCKVSPGDGVVFDLGRPDEEESGGFVTSVGREGPDLRLHFHHPSVRWEGVRVGAIVWKTSDPALEKSLRQSYCDNLIHVTRPVSFVVSGAEGEPLGIHARDDGGNEAWALSSMVLAKAGARSLDLQTLSAQLSRLGGSPFHMEGLESRLAEGLSIPVGELNRMRRALVEELVLKRRAGPSWSLLDAPASCEVPPSGAHVASEALLVPLVRDMAQLEAVLPLAREDVYAEFENHKDYREAVRRVRAWRDAHGGVGPLLWAAPPRVFKDGEEWILNIIASAEPDGILVRCAEHMAHFKGRRLRGDSSLNVANQLAAEFFVRGKGLEGVTASSDLDIDQLADLLSSAPPEWFEITLHQHMPMFHMEHCVFCAFLSEGHDYHDCGRPCEKRRVYLRDRTGAEHYLRADAGCRNTLFNARAQTGADYAARLMVLGARRFRVEFLEEDADEVVRIMDRYGKLLDGSLDGAAIWREFKLLNQIGVTRGTMGVRTTGAGCE
jgi:putative protease